MEKIYELSQTLVSMLVGLSNRYQIDINDTLPLQQVVSSVPEDVKEIIDTLHELLCNKFIVGDKLDSLAVIRESTLVESPKITLKLAPTVTTEGEYILCYLITPVGRIAFPDKNIKVYDALVNSMCQLEPKVIPDWIQTEVRETWNAMKGVGQIEAYRILECMVDRIGYGRFDRVESLVESLKDKAPTFTKHHLHMRWTVKESMDAIDFQDVTEVNPVFMIDLTKLFQLLSNNTKANVYTAFPDWLKGGITTNLPMLAWVIIGRYCGLFNMQDLRTLDMFTIDYPAIRNLIADTESGYLGINDTMTNTDVYNKFVDHVLPHVKQKM